MFLRLIRIYSSHCLEHLSFENAKYVIKEMHRVLIPGGLVRIVLPDLRYYIERYKKQKMSLSSKVEAADNFVKGLNIITKSRDPHLWMYDFDSIAERLENAGFKDIKEYSFGQGDCIDLEILDNRPTDSLFIEARK